MWSNPNPVSYLRELVANRTLLPGGPGMILYGRGHMMNGFNAEIPWNELDDTTIIQLHSQDPDLIWVTFKGQMYEVRAHDLAKMVKDQLAMLKAIGE